MPDSHRNTTTPQRVRPRWKLVSISMAVSGAIPLAAVSPRTALYWYIWPLFGLGVSYVLQFRHEFPRRWIVAAAGMAPLSAIALAFNWPFSGHIMWNIVLIGHASTTGKRRSAWMGLLVVSLVHLFVLKAVTQSGRDLAGGFVSLVVGGAILAALSAPRR